MTPFYYGYNLKHYPHAHLPYITSYSFKALNSLFPFRPTKLYCLDRPWSRRKVIILFVASSTVPPPMSVTAATWGGTKAIQSKFIYSILLTGVNHSTWKNCQKHGCELGVERYMYSYWIEMVGASLHWLKNKNQMFLMVVLFYTEIKYL